MSEKTDSFLTTSQAARLCSVTPDAVLKWIKSGKIDALRTAGGHYRIPRDVIARLVCTREEQVAEVSSLQERRKRFQFCWEYFARQGEIDKGCLRCIVYHARSMRCWEMSSLSSKYGFTGIHCKSTCDDCSYRKDRRSRPFNIVVVTDNKGLKSSLVDQSEGTRFILRFASCEYECSSLVDKFRPDYIVLDDSCFEKARCEELCSHLMQDPRIPQVRIILAASSPRSIMKNDSRIYKRIKKPLTARKLERYIDYKD